MEAKLIKTDVNYLLEDNKGVVIGSTSTKEINKLSKQNCDDIFGVIDVEKLDRKIRGLMMINGTSSGTIDHPNTDKMISLFNKAMELNKDKVFTEEQMFRMFLFGHSLSEAIKRGVIEDKAVGEIFNDRIQFLQQPSEIEVEIEMEWITTKTFCDTCNKVMYPDYRCEDKTCFNWQPKLDSSGCLTLKKI